MSQLLNLNSYKSKMLYSLFVFIFILTSCSTFSEPVYEAVYEPISDQYDQESFQSSYVACYELALLEAVAASDRVWERQLTALPVLSYMHSNGITSGLNNSSSSPTSSLYYYSYNMADGSNRRTAMQADKALQDTWEESKKDCMMENGFREIRIYAENSSE